MPDLTVEQFEQRIKGAFLWLTINREGLAEVAQDLKDAAAHIEQVGWTQNRNFEVPTHQKTSPCCAVGALWALERPDSDGFYVGTAVWTFEAVAQQGLVTFNDLPTTEASQVTDIMRTVAQNIDDYLEQTRDQSRPIR